ncbi:hypothetical protein GLA29479_1336 [Lysobacter antibioticus]|jgi:hypothetical protein|uniref:Uncharacterized protein n=1 Tax=Lysobacter antibioticus TaxID=84531 RepID=A0A0S2DUW4_LYSAN|nr:hypothetical protein [Lysobacter antibioticus]ALN62220.1 hypothetical protein GLA29479_1336 [Lysobacter antibioticus]ALN78198.1 hypothetical protein LA76x_0036 [Lysobacter antibioticus]
MPYQINRCFTPLNIGECEWASAQAILPVNGQAVPTVQFGNFTSCIGIVASNVDATEVIGIHLVMINDQDEAFTAADVPTVMALLADFPENQCIVGQIGWWQDNVGPAFDALVNALPNAGQSDQGDGIYGAGLNSVDQLEVLFQPLNP